MKIVTREIPVCSQDGKVQIGRLSCGDTALVLGSDECATYIAYIVGRIETEYATYLVDAEKWASTVSAGDRFLAFITAQVGCLYVLGAQGQKMTPELIKRLEHVTEKNCRRALEHFNKHVSSGETLVAYDCSGLIVSYLLAEKMIGTDLTADGLYFKACDPIEKDELQRGDLVFKKYATKNQMYHVGVYVGDNRVVHAKGREDGVVEESMSVAGWNRYGRLRCFMSELIPVYTRVLKVTGRPYISGDDVRAVQRGLKAAGFDPGEADGSYGPKTEKAVKAYQAGNELKVDGIVGPRTWEKLFR